MKPPPRPKPSMKKKSNNRKRLVCTHPKRRTTTQKDLLFVLTQSFGIFAESVTRKDVRNEAKAAVVEAPAKSVLPVSHLENGLID